MENQLRKHHANTKPSIGDDLLTVARIEDDEVARHDEIGEMFERYVNGEITRSQYDQFRTAADHREGVNDFENRAALKRINRESRQPALRRLGGFVRRHL